MIMAYLSLIVECLIFSELSSLYNFDSYTNEALGIFIVLINILVVILVGVFKSSKGDEKICKIILLSFVMRVGLLFIDLYGRNVFVLPGSGNDTEMFHAGALLFPNFEFEKNPYAFVVGIIYSLCMKQRIVAQYFNLLLSISVIFIIIKICDELNINYKTKIMITLIIALIPNYMILSVILLRESLMIFLVALSLLTFVMWWKQNKIIYFILSIALVLGASVFHSGVIANAVGYILVFILFNNKSRDIKINLKTVTLSILFMIIISAFLSSNSNIFTQKVGNVEEVQDITYRSELAQAGGAVYETNPNNEENNSLLGLIINSPTKMFYFITSPLPWNWRGLNDVIAFVFSAMFYIISYIYAIKAIRLYTKYKEKNIIKACLIISLVGVFVFAWGTSNAGTAMRHRDKFIANYIVMLALSLDLLYKHDNKLIGEIENEGQNKCYSTSL